MSIGTSSRDDLLGSTRMRWGVAAILVLLAAAPRVYRLGAESLSGDEDYTWIAATAVAEGRGAVMPSGMPYRRALPFTWANAAVVSLLGSDGNVSVRVVTAAAGAITPGVVFLAGCSFVSPSVALVAATMLTVSEWHVSRSRHGRMYPPLALTFFLTGVLFWRWAREGGLGLGGAAIALLAGTTALHLLGIPAAQTALFAIVLPGALAVSPWALLGIVAASTAAFYGANQAIVQAPYGEWALPRSYALDGVDPGAVDVVRAEPSLLLIGVGLAIGVWWAFREPEPEGSGLRRRLRQLVCASTVIATAIAMTHGHLIAAMLTGLVSLLLRPRSPARFVREGGWPLAILLTIGVGWLLFAVLDGGVASGVRRVAGSPYLYLRSLWPAAPGVTALFLLGTVGLTWAPGGTAGDAPDQGAETPPPGTIDDPVGTGLRAAALAAWVPLIGLGIATPHGPSRFAFMLLPFISLVAAWPLVVLAGGLVKVWRPESSPRWPPAIVVGLVLLGAVPGHGLWSSFRPANVDYLRIAEDIPADHETPGRFLAGALQPGDVVIAQDETMAYVYVGRVDYWFRRAGDARRFLYLAADAEPRSKYANARLLASVDGVRRVVEEAEGRVWFITSGETVIRPASYLSPEQATWLGQLQIDREPAVIGRDGVSAVYCLNC